MSKIVFVGDWVRILEEEDTHYWYRVTNIEDEDLLCLHDGSTMYAEDWCVKEVLSNKEFCQSKGICPTWESTNEVY